MSAHHQFHLYNEETGLFTGETFITNDNANAAAFGAANVRPGHKHKKGDYDPLCQRVDPKTGVVVDYVPPKPSAEHEWSDEVRRWLPNTASVQRRVKLAAAQKALAALEAQSPKLLREAQLGRPGAQARLEQLDKDIQTQEAIIHASQPNNDPERPQRD